MNEDFLHYVWKYKLLDQISLKTTQGENIEIIKQGEHNLDAGPDFFNAQIKINNTIWAGNIEIHLKSSDWDTHVHQNNSAYNNVILHVVLNHDKEIQNQKGNSIPTLELKFRILPNIITNYEFLKKQKTKIPCAYGISEVNEITIASWLERMLYERLETKTSEIKHQLQLSKNNWEETFYFFLAKNFGFKVNAEPFYLLAKSLNINTLSKHKNNLIQIESLLFGQAGMLQKSLKDEYFKTLQNEYTFLSHKYKLIPIATDTWKFMRMRPKNFPTIRIAQFAQLVFKSSSLFSKILDSKNIDELRKLFEVQASEYWDSHYQFGKTSSKSKKDLGEQSFQNVLINTIVPFLFLYGKEKQDEIYIERAINLLECIEPEQNKIIASFDELNIKAKNAGDTQSLIQLNNNYCKFKKCLNCAIGNHLMSKK